MPSNDSDLQMTAMAKNDKHLGRGLDALLGGAKLPVNENGATPAVNNGYVRIDSIEANPYQPRSRFDEEALGQLAQSIRTYGLIQPVTVRPAENGKYQLISGERRFRAAKMAGLTEIPAFVRTVDDIQSIQMALVENIQRSDLNAIEIAVCYQLLIDEGQMKQEELSGKVGKDRSTISNYLRLLKLSSEAQAAVRDNLIAMGHARALLPVEDEQQQGRIVRQVIDGQLSVRQTEAIVKKYLASTKAPKTKVKINLSDEVVDFKNELSRRLKTRVRVKKDISGKGVITIPFASDDDLKRIMSSLQ